MSGDGLGCDDEDATYALVPEPLDRVQHRVPVEGQEVDDTHEVAGSVGCALDPNSVDAGP